MICNNERKYDDMREENNPTPEAKTQDGPEQEPQVPLPRIYVASLTDYNHAVLHGAWIDLDGDQDRLWQQVNTMLEASPTARRYGERAEEWAIHDYEQFGPLHLGEHDDLNQLNALAGHVARHGPAFLAWAQHQDLQQAGADDAAERFEDAYQGHHNSPEAYGEQLLDDFDVDIEQIEDIPTILQPYIKIDVEALVRDMELSGEIDITGDPDGGIYVFWTF
jgi:antirestriction protein